MRERVLDRVTRILGGISDHRGRDDLDFVGAACARSCVRPHATAYGAARSRSFHHPGHSWVGQKIGRPPPFRGSHSLRTCSSTEAPFSVVPGWDVVRGAQAQKRDRPNDRWSPFHADAAGDWDCQRKICAFVTPPLYGWLYGFTNRGAQRFPGKLQSRCVGLLEVRRTMNKATTARSSARAGVDVVLLENTPISYVISAATQSILQPLSWCASWD